MTPTVETVTRWIREVLDRAAPYCLAPCPFARPSLDAGRICIVEASRYADDVKVAVARWSDEYDAVVVVKAGGPGDDDLQEICAEATAGDIAALPVVSRNGLSMVNDISIVVIQRLSALDAASEQLERTDYFRQYGENA